MILPHKVLSCAMLEWTEQWFVYYAVLHSHCFINTIATSASLVLGAWCLVVCIIRLGHVEFMGDLMLNKPLQTWFKMTVIPLVHHSGPWQLGLAPAGWFLVPSGSHLQHPSAGSWGSCPNMMGGDCWSAVTPGIPGPSESPCPVEQPSLFYLVDCMQHEMAVHMLVPFCIYHVWHGLWAKARCKGLGNQGWKRTPFCRGELCTAMAWIQAGNELAPSSWRNVDGLSLVQITTASVSSWVQQPYYIQKTVWSNILIWWLFMVNIYLYRIGHIIILCL